jgi:hypothetical protein
MKLNISLILKSISLVLIVIVFFIPLYYFRFSISSNFNYFYINDLYTQQDGEISIFTFYYLFVALIILFGIFVDYFPSPIGSFQKTFKSINLALFGSYITLSLFFLFETIFIESFWNVGGEDNYIITPALYLIVLSAILFFLSLFLNSKSFTKKIDNQNKVLPYEQLTKLKKLYDEKVLTEEEFIDQKKSLMES